MPHLAAAGRGIVALGSALSALGAVHATVNARRLRRPVLGGSVHPPVRVSVLVPARDEAATITACVDALRGPYELLVLDDGSGDGTGDLARAAGARVLPGAPVPAGWLGKPWACAQLAAAADPVAEVLVFVDADVEVHPGAVAAAVRLLLDNGLDIACPFPRQVAVTPAERLVQPLLQWSWLTTLPLRVAERSTRPSLTAACGQLMVVRRDALERAGGFAGVRTAALDDVALVRAVKAVGGRGGVVDGTDLATCRMYTGWATLRDGYGKSLWTAFGGGPAAIAAIGTLVLAWVVPPVAALFGSRVGTVGYAAGVAGRVVSARRTGGRVFPDALAQPASVAALAWLTARSTVLHRRGALRWKDRPVSV